MIESNLDKLISAVSKIRRVKHGDIIMADDHNSIVDALDTLCNILQPSGISPYTYLPDLDVLDHFLSPSISYVGWARYTNWYLPVSNASYNTNVRDISKAVLNNITPAWTYYVYGDDAANMTFSKIAFTFKPINPEQYDKCINTVFNYYDDGLSNSNHIGHNFTVGYGWYDDSGYIFIIDNYVENSFVFEPLNVRYTVYAEIDGDLGKDWMVCVVDNMGDINIYDINGNSVLSYHCVGETNSQPENYQLNLYAFIQEGPSQNTQLVSISYDWVAFKWAYPGYSWL